MKVLFLFLFPLITLFVSSCSSGPRYEGGGGTAVYYDGYGPGPNPRPGYYWNGTVYVSGTPPHRHSDHGYNAYRENDVNVNRTTYNDRTVNDTTINRTNVNDRNVQVNNVNRRNVNKTNVASSNVNKRNVTRNNVEATHRKVAPGTEKKTAHPKETPVP